MQVGLSVGVCAAAGVAAASLPAITLAAVPRIGGDGSLMGTLTLDPVVASPADASVALQWLRDTVSVPGETGATYRKTAADAGARVRVLVRCFRAGYAPLFAYSNVISLMSNDWLLEGAVVLNAPGAPARPEVSASIIEV